MSDDSKNAVKKLIADLLSKEIVKYIIAGGFTTLVNLIVSWLLYEVIGIEENATTAIAWIVAVAFAYVINNYWVFKTGKEKAGKEIVKIAEFTGSRLITYVLEALGVYIFITRLQYNFWLIKIILMVIVTLLNYVFSKMIVFVKKKEA